MNEQKAPPSYEEAVRAVTQGKTISIRDLLDLFPGRIDIELADLVLRHMEMEGIVGRRRKMGKREVLKRAANDKTSFVPIVEKRDLSHLKEDAELLHVAAEEKGSISRIEADNLIGDSLRAIRAIRLLQANKVLTRMDETTGVAKLLARKECLDIPQNPKNPGPEIPVLRDKTSEEGSGNMNTRKYIPFSVSELGAYPEEDHTEGSQVADLELTTETNKKKCSDVEALSKHQILTAELERLAQENLTLETENKKLKQEAVVFRQRLKDLIHS